MARFEIVKITPTSVEVVSGLPIITSGKDAKHYAAQLTIQNPGVKFQPRPVRDVEGGHKQTGLIDVPWEGIIEHPFLDMKYDPKEKVLRFFRTQEAKEFSKSESSLVFTFLNQRITSEEEVFFWMDLLDPSPHAEYSFGIARTEKEILDVYYGKGNIDSCMNKRAGFYVESKRPVCCYATEDFGIAWIRDDSGRLKARCVVSPVRMIYGRIYGNAQIMKWHLQKAGYMYGVAADWRGLRLKTEHLDGSYIDHSEDDGEDMEDLDYDSAEGWHAPYSDVLMQAMLSPDNKFMVLDFDGDYSLGCTHGLAEKEYDLDEQNCEKCNKLTYQPIVQSDSIDDKGGYLCWECHIKKHGQMGHDHCPPNVTWDVKPVVLMDDGYLAYPHDQWSYKQCSVTKKWYTKRRLPLINNERLTPSEMEKKYAGHQHIYGYAYLPETKPVKD